jgi:hypothetical protein
VIDEGECRRRRLVFDAGNASGLGEWAPVLPPSRPVSKLGQAGDRKRAAVSFSGILPERIARFEALLSNARIAARMRVALIPRALDFRAPA